MLHLIAAVTIGVFLGLGLHLLVRLTWTTWLVRRERRHQARLRQATLTILARSQEQAGRVFDVWRNNWN